MLRLARTGQRFRLLRGYLKYHGEAALDQRVGAPTWLARTRIGWARALLTRHAPGDAEQADHLLEQALDDARRLGLAGVEGRAAVLLGRLS